MNAQVVARPGRSRIVMVLLAVAAMLAALVVTARVARAADVAPVHFVDGGTGSPAATQHAALSRSGGEHAQLVVRAQRSRSRGRPH